jgi:hypothetical protein
MTARRAAAVRGFAQPDMASSQLSERERLASALSSSRAATSDCAHVQSSPRLSLLGQIFQLSAWEVDAVAVLWVCAFDASLRAKWLGSSSGALAPVTPLAVTSLWGHRPRVRLGSTSAVLLWQIVSESEMRDGGCALVLDPHLLAWLEGEHEPDRMLIGRVRPIAAGDPLSAWPLTDIAERLRSGLAQGERWRLRVAADDTELALRYCSAVAARVELPALQLIADSLAGEDARDVAIRLHRQAYLDRAALVVDERDAERACPTGVEPFPLQFVVGTRPLTPVPGVRDWLVQLPRLNASDRRALWLAALPTATAWPASALDDLVTRHDVGIGDILRAAAQEPADADAAAQSLHRDAGGDLHALAKRLECSFRWDDLVVPEPLREQLEELAFEALERPRFWSDAQVTRLFPQGRGLIALLAGPPGTGKTMAAQVIAAELGLPLWRIDLSAVLSKWVGETAKHLQKVLSSRDARGAVLLFDEADALYGKRIEDTRDAQDRFANMDISHLMVAIEAHEGIVLLSTNLKGNIDSAFLRRIRHVIDFPRPDTAARHRIWQQMTRVLFGAGAVPALAAALPRLAQVAATGAQIKNAALSAAFTARRRRVAPDLALLGGALTRELAKEGASVTPRDFELPSGGRHG